MTTLLKILVSIMSNPITNGVLLAALITSNVFTITENNALERKIDNMIQMQEREMEEKEAKEALDKQSNSDAKSRSDEFFKKRSKEFEELKWYGPREY